MLEERVKKKYPSLTNNQKRVAERFLSLGHDAAFLTVDRVARQLKTSGATLVRFARSLGYRGYPDLQQDLRQNLLEKASPPQTLKESIEKKGGRDIYSEIIEIEQQNLRSARQLNKNEIIELAVNEIVKAKKVGVSGFRSSSSTAYLLYILLSDIRGDCQFLEYESGSRASQLIHYGEGDLFICFSLPRYSQQTFANLVLVKKNKCKTIAVTDSALSPFGQKADLVLLVGNQSSTYFNFFASAVVLIECLVAGVSLRHKGSLANLKRVNGVLTEWEALIR